MPWPGQGGIEILWCLDPGADRRRGGLRPCDHATRVAAAVFVHVSGRASTFQLYAERDWYAQRKTVQNFVETSQVQGMVVGGPVNRSGQ